MIDPAPGPLAATPSQADAFWMARALAEAARGQGRVEPNPMVGACVVRDGRLVGVGHHTRFGGPHAEVEALRDAGPAAAGATLYVTLEPCCHHGKTPPCTEAIRAAGISRVVAAVPDPFPQVACQGIAALREAGIAVTLGVLEPEARRLLAPFAKLVTTSRPFVIAKWAMTLDGKLACASGDSRWISGTRSRMHAHATRGRVDAILVGIGTALRDDPTLTARPPGARLATRIVLDSQARLPVDSRLAQSAREVPLLVAVTPRAPQDRIAALQAQGAEVLVLPGGELAPVAITALLDVLGRRRMTNLLVEGGGQVLGQFFDSGAVDAVEVYVAPRVEGGSHAYTPTRGQGVDWMRQALRLADVTIERLDDDVLIQGRFPPTGPLAP